MLFFICLIATIVFLVPGIVWFGEFHRIKDIIASVFAPLGVLFGIVLLVMSIIVLVNNVGSEGTLAASEAQYEMIVYQLENDIYDNDNDLGKKELYNEITQWNTSLARYKAVQRDFWIGIFYPNIYDDLEFIEFPEVT